MAEETQQPTQDNVAELATLRSTLAEVKQKSSTRKARIAELEAANADLQSQLAQANASLRIVTIDKPLQEMSEAISTAPDAWIENFNKTYRLEAKDGAITLLTSEGKPVNDKAGNAVPFRREALIALLTDEKHPNAQFFRATTIVSRATGAAASSTVPKGVPVPKSAKLHFGLR